MESSLTKGGYSETTFNYVNQCTNPVWTAASPSIEDAMPEKDPGNLYIFYTPDVWTGSIWARTKCTTNATFYFSCETGDCGTGEEDCQGPPPTYPVTLLNFDINQAVVTYEVSLNHGYNNVPVRIQPVGGSLLDGSGPCPVVDCIQDLSNVCPASLVAKNKDGAQVGCFSACDGLKDPKFCCTGAFSGPACQPNQYSESFKKLCGLAHTYPTDNNPPIYKCNGATAYNITFCPT
ncbi:hypothetical protein L1049_002442 [Liquidambar formosana]|uniref:Thaumatin-like protein n=1 Tax=Liquidambar formosana TaxID=63359 RepID=A0AAP0NFN5_LIQFO